MKLPPDIRALSLTRPWPYVILHLGKRIENRSRKDERMPDVCKHRGPLLLHSAKSWADIADDLHAAELALSPHDYVLRNKANHPAGAIVGLCVVTGHIEPWTCSSCGGSRGEWRSCGECTGTLDELGALDLCWYYGGWALILDDVQALKPVACKGALGLWRPPADVIAQLEAA